MSPVHYCVPTDTAKALGTDYPLDCDNFGLLLARFVPHEAIRSEKNVDVIRDHKGKEIDTIRGDWLRKVCKLTPTPAQLEHQKALLARWQAQTKGASHFRMVARGRLIVGLGGKGALEIGITLHHTTGLPYIPGSALKGLARSYALLTLAEKHNVALDDVEAFDKRLIAGHLDSKEESAPLYREAFGHTVEQKHDIGDSAAGAVIFYDGVLSVIPNANPLFTVDVMTPHFSEYYRSSGGKAPHDADGPIPVNYITVAVDVAFDFAVGLRRGGSDEARRQARKWLRAGLQEMGVGAKTAAGYGVFMRPPERG